MKGLFVVNSSIPPFPIDSLQINSNPYYLGRKTFVSLALRKLPGPTYIILKNVGDWLTADWSNKLSCILFGEKKTS